jgi:nitrate/nitrite transporter NarK
MFVAGKVAQKIIARRGPKLAVWLGLLIEAAGLVAMSFIGPDSSYAADVLPGFLLTAVGAGFAFAPLFLIASAGVEPAESGLASGLINTSQQLGSAIGLAVLSSVAAAYTGDLVAHGTGAAEALTKGFDRGFEIAAVIMAVAALVALIGLRSTDGRRAPAPVQPEPTPVTNLEPALGD